MKNVALRTIFIFILLLFEEAVHAQSASFSVTDYSVDQGLHDHRVTHIYEGPDNFVWISTYDGLSRFDGFEFIKIPLLYRPGLVVNSSGPLITRSGMIDSLHLGLVYQESLKDSLDAINLKDYSLKTIPMDDIKMQQFNHQFRPWNLISEDQYTLQDRVGNVMHLNLSGATPSLILTTNSNDTLDLTSVIQKKALPNISGNDFSRVFYIKRSVGFSKVVPYFTRFKSIVDRDLPSGSYGNIIRAITKINDRELLISIERDKLIIYNKDLNQFKPLIIKNKVEQRPPNPYYYNFHQVSDSIIYGLCYQSGLHKINLAKATFERVNDLFFKEARHCIMYDSITILASGLISHPDYQGEVLVEYNLKENLYKVHLLDLLPIAHIIENGYLFKPKNQKQIWIGTSTGLYKFDLKNSMITEAYCYKEIEISKYKRDYPVYNILSAYSIFNITEKDNKLWLALDQGGVNILDYDQKKIEYINKEIGLSDDRIPSLVNTDKGMWISSYNGLNYLDHSTGLITNFYEEDGIPHNEFNRFSFYKDEDKIYLGTMNGIAIINTKDTLPTANKINLLLSNVLKYEHNDSKELSVIYKPNVSHYTIPNKRRNIRFNFATSDFTKPEDVLYEYQLVSHSILGNQDNFWLSNGQNHSIAFDHLDAGSYTLNVRAKNSTGGVSQINKIEFLVKDFYYNSWWFRLLAISILIFIGYLIFKNRLTQALKIEKLKTQLSSDLHDDVGSILSGVAYQMELLETSVPDSQKSLVKQIAESSRKAMSQMRDVVWAVNSNNDAVIDLVERMRDNAEEMIGYGNIMVTVDAIFDLQHHKMTHNQKHNLLLIFKEFLSNSIKHSEATKVEVLISSVNKKVQIKLTDNGKGMDLSRSNHSGIGIKNINHRIRLIGEEPVWTNNNGTQLLFLLKK